MSASPPSSVASRRTLRRGVAMLRVMTAMHPGTFAIAIGGASVYALATVASSFAIQWVTDNVILPRFDQGEVAAATVAAGVVFVIAVGVVRAVAVVTRRGFAASVTSIAMNPSRSATKRYRN